MINKNIVYEHLSPIEKVEYIQRLIYMTNVDSLNRIVLNGDIKDDDIELGEFVADEISLEEIISEKMTSERLNDYVSTLRPREVAVIRLRYGLVDGRCHTLEDIGAVYGLTRERIRQIERSALKKLKNRMIKNGIKHAEDL